MRNEYFQTEMWLEYCLKKMQPITHGIHHKAKQMNKNVQKP